MIGLRRMDSIYGDILFRVRGGSYTNRRSKLRQLLPPFPLLSPPLFLTVSLSFLFLFFFFSLSPSSSPSNAGNYRLFFPISFQDKFQIPRSYFWGSLLYTTGRNQDDRYARTKSVHRASGLKTPDRSPAPIGHEPNAFNKEWIRRIIRCM